MVDKTDSGKVSRLLIHKSIVQDSGQYRCEASNAHGTVEADFNLIVQGEKN